MLLRFNPYIAFLIAILYSVFLGYIFRSGVVAYGPLIALGGLVLLSEFNTKNKLSFKYWIIVFAWLSYVLWAGYVYLKNPLEGKYLSTHFLSILILPLITLSLFRLLKSQGSEAAYKKLYVVIFCFLFFQLIICLGQISTYSFGVGLPVSEMHAENFMVSGTFTNSNDLAAIVLASVFFVIGLEKYFFKNDKYIFWMLAVFLLLITGSRSAIILVGILFIVSKLNKPTKIPYYILIGIVAFLISTFTLEYFSANEAVSRFVARINSLLNILQHGTSGDGSMTARINSYLHFLKKLPELGFGSGEINNYFKYSTNSDFRMVELLFQNPHSLVVELGYWLGWPGLIFFFTPLLFLLRFSRRKLSLIIVFLIVSMIPSSIMGSMVFFLFLLLCFFDYRPINENNLPSSTPF